MNNPSPLTIQAHRTYQIGLWTGIIFAAISVLSTIITIQTKLFAFGGIALTVVVSLAAFATAILSKQGRAALGSKLLIGIILIGSLFLPLIAKGQGIPLAVLIVIIVSSIASNTLTGRSLRHAILSSIGIGILIILVDLYLPSFGIKSDPRVTYVFTALAGLFYAWMVFRQFYSYPLRIKLLISFIVVTIIPLAALGYYSYITTLNRIQSAAQNNLTNLASNTANVTDSYLRDQLDEIKSEAQFPGIIDYMAAPASERSNGLLENNARRTLQIFSQKDPNNIISYALYDTTGRKVLDTAPQESTANLITPDYVQTPLKSGYAYVSNLFFTPNGDARLYFSTPIQSQSGIIIGILSAEIKGTIIQNTILSVLPENNLRRSVQVIDKSTYINIGDTNTNALFKSIKNFTSEEISSLQAQGKIMPGDITAALAPDDQLMARITGLEDASFFTTTTQYQGETVDAYAAGRSLQNQPWVVVALAPQQLLLAPVEDQNKTFVPLSLLLLVISAGLSSMVAQYISRPVISLSNAAQAAATGNLNIRAVVSTRDEVGNLANTFNSMIEQLNLLVGNLEENVQSRTAALEIATKAEEQRAAQLKNITDISKIITREQKLEKLLPLISDTVSEKFGFYHVGIFLLNQKSGLAVLQAANSQGGLKMLDRGYKIEVSANNLIGSTLLSGSPHTVSANDEKAAFSDNPDLPETRAEMTLPLITRGSALGVIDLHSNTPRAFTQEDINTLSTLADQIAIAIENTRLIEQTQTALDESQSVIRSFLRQEWSKMLEQKKSVGYMLSGTSGQALTNPVQNEDVKQAIRKGHIIKRDNNQKASEAPSVVVPIKLGDETVGAIRVQSPHENHVWSNDEVALLRSISERVGLALENARLIENSQKRASKEQVISAISAKISAAPDMNNILEIAVEELGHILAGSDVVIQFTQENDFS